MKTTTEASGRQCFKVYYYYFLKNICHLVQTANLKWDHNDYVINAEHTTKKKKIKTNTEIENVILEYNSAQSFIAGPLTHCPQTVSLVFLGLPSICIKHKQLIKAYQQSTEWFCNSEQIYCPIKIHNQYKNVPKKMQLWSLNLSPPFPSPPQTYLQMKIR
jgi:hypothetical protein